MAFDYPLGSVSSPAEKTQVNSMRYMGHQTLLKHCPWLQTPLQQSPLVLQVPPRVWQQFAFGPGPASREQGMVDPQEKPTSDAARTTRSRAGNLIMETFRWCSAGPNSTFARYGVTSMVNRFDAEQSLQALASHLASPEHLVTTVPTQEWDS